MGFRAASTLFIAPLLLAAPALALAQQDNATDPVFNLPRTQPQTDPNRQGPELDVFRGGPTTVLPPPPIVAPTVTPPPAVTPAPQPAPRQPAPPAAQPSQPAPSASRPAPVQPAPTPEAAPAPAIVPQPEPQPTPETAPQPAPQSVEPPLAPASESTSWTWVAAGLAALAAAVAAAWLLRRRPRTGDGEEDSFVEVESTPSAPPAAAAKPPAPRPAPPRPAPAPPPGPVPTSRPQIDLAMEVRGARLSLMGATIDYTLVVHNRGERAAEDILIRSFIANADAAQQGGLAQFFAGQRGLPTHSIVSVAPGEGARLTGELRLLPDQIAPVQMGDRALLIPLVAFDAQYRWTDESDDPAGQGRTGRAFIVGQEKTPPADRLAPFRIDLGPRQYRTPGSRATEVALTS